MSKTPEAQGLYDPRNEHDACGVGFVADVKGRKSHEIVQEGLEILLKLDHRGAVGADPLAGDGAGLLSQIPDQFFRKQHLGFTLPPFGSYAVGQIFLPQDKKNSLELEELVEFHCRDEGLTVLGWRDVPVNSEGLGISVIKTEPTTKQIFVTADYAKDDQDKFERKVFVARKSVANKISGEKMPGFEDFYISSTFSSMLYDFYFLPFQSVK